MLTKAMLAKDGVMLELRATGNADEIRVVTAYEVRRGRGTRLVDRPDLRKSMTLAGYDELVAEGWREERSGYGKRFRDAVVAGRTYDVLAEIERSA